VITNLLANAIKFGQGRPIRIVVRGAGDRARLEVHDRGIGIAPGDRERIFERFERAVSASHFGGLGLGLYISREIVVAHGGTIHIDSQPGSGTTFTVELPKLPPPPSQSEPPDDLGLPRMRN
jgi:signal transduction histidine kinase